MVNKSQAVLSAGFLEYFVHARYFTSQGLVSSVVQPGKDETFTREFLDILWPWRFLRIESPAIIISFRWIDCICSGSLGGSIGPDRLLVRFFCEHEGLLLFLSSLFVL